MIANTLYSILPLFVLFALFMVGFYYAWTDFRPRILNGSKDGSWIGKSVDRRAEQYAPIAEKRKEYSLKELGIGELGNLSALTAQEKRKLKMDERVRHYAIDSPEAAASVVQKWLKE